MDLELLHDFLAVCNEKTLSKAAEKRHTTQPSLSRSIQKLEYEIECPLFDRTRNRIVLNENGIIAKQYAEMILHEAEMMKSEIQRNEKRKSRISFGSCAPIPLDMITEQLFALFPEMTLTGTMSDEEDLREGLSAGIYQLIITRMPSTEKDEISRLFCTEKLYLSIPKEDPLSHKRVISFAEMNGRPFLLNTRIGIWKDFVHLYLPDSHFLMQSDIHSLDLVAQHSSLPAFTTDLSIRRNGIRVNHTAIPFSDREASVCFYLTCRNTDSERFSPLFSKK